MHSMPVACTSSCVCRFGISSFVYSRRRPFHPQRLRDVVLKWMPVSHNKAAESDPAAANTSPMRAVMRSKGFAWMAHGHANAFFWSHAGQHFELRCDTALIVHSTLQRLLSRIRPSETWGICHCLMLCVLLTVTLQPPGSHCANVMLFVCTLRNLSVCTCTAVCVHVDQQRCSTSLEPALNIMILSM
jgi:Cobalamin synthesis protein cobW C-terminal domain